MKTRKYIIITVSTFSLLLLGACGFNVEKNEESGVETTDNNAAGITLAGQEPVEQVGIIKSFDSTDEVIITVDQEDITYRLSEDAKEQIESNEIVKGAKVTFTTYTIGDEMETIDKFNVE
jgi:hypothetical protein